MKCRILTITVIVISLFSSYHLEAQEGPMNGNKEKMAKRFAKMDLNNSGDISFKEFAMRGNKNRKMKENFEGSKRGINKKEAFARMDSDNNGVLTRDEFMKARKRAQRRKGRR